VLDRAQSFDIETFVFNREQFYNSEDVLKMLLERDIDFIVLAGFLWLVPAYILQPYENKIVNIHPALLPKFGGKGMYGTHVHRAVIDAGEPESGISIHYVNQKYDEGNIICHARCKVDPGDTPVSLAAKVHELEYKYFPGVVENLLKEL